MLKYLSKFAMDILPSVVATIIGAYIVNHYIVSKPTADAPGRGVVRRSKKASGRNDAAPAEVSPTSPISRQRGSGRRASPKNRSWKNLPPKNPPRRRQRTNPPRSPNRSRRRRRAFPADMRRHPPALREKTAAKLRHNPGADPVTPVVAAPAPPGRGRHRPGCIAMPTTWPVPRSNACVG